MTTTNRGETKKFNPRHLNRIISFNQPNVTKLFDRLRPMLGKNSKLADASRILIKLERALFKKRLDYRKALFVCS